MRIPKRITTPSPLTAILATDGYKQSHRLLFPEGTTRVLINWTNRSNKLMPGSKHAVVFGLQAFIQSFLVETFEKFFQADEDEMADEFETVLENYFGPNNIGSDHIRALHKLGYLPLEIKALPEGTLAPMGVATLTIENTHDDFFWLPNYIETALSAELWHPTTTATIALAYRDLMEKWALKTTGSIDGVDFQAHDFSMRGQTSLASVAASGAGHLTSFLGTDSMPAFDFIDRYYPAYTSAGNGLLGASVPATEHSVMCIRGQQGEKETFEQILRTFPSGIVSAVSDGYDLWKVITETLVDLKDEIMARDGKLVIRPDSGDPVDILCGTISGAQSFDNGPRDYPAEQKGVIELLWDIFGGTTNEQGYKVLDSHIGAIYGDSITLERAEKIFERMAAKGFATTNVVLGIGSFTYQYVTRDNLGSAVKATWALVDGEPVNIQKDPVTGHGKKSAKGRIVVARDHNTGELVQIDQASEKMVEAVSLLKTVWVDGEFTTIQSFADVRNTLQAAREARA